MSESKDGWDKLGVVGQLIGSIVIPVVVLLLGYQLDGTLNEGAEARRQGNDLARMQLAVDILREPPDETSTALRRWAVDGLQGGSEVQLAPDDAKQLLTRPLPTRSFGRVLDGRNRPVAPVNPGGG